MNEGVWQETQPAGRRISVLCWGDNVGELEMSALDEARAFFGEGWRLAVVPDYQVIAVRPHWTLPERATGKRYQSHMLVRIVEPEPGESP